MASEHVRRCDELLKLPEGVPQMANILLPKVSVIINNYNYQDMIEAAVDSALAQTYPNLELIIVDDGSTDESVRRIDEICRSRREINAIRLPVNRGQTLACLAGLESSSGVYVIFLDSDDRMMPECVEAHIYAHLSSRIPVAFTSVDVTNCAGGQDVVLSQAGFGAYVTGGSGSRPGAIRPIHKAVPDSWFGIRPPVIRPEQIHFTLPPRADPWVWSPSSASCYRRDAVDLLMQTPGLEAVRWIDVYLMRSLSALFGSILIDKPLVRYVIHGGNYLTRCAPLNRYLSFDRASEAKETAASTRAAIAKLFSQVEAHGPRYLRPGIFFDAVEALCRAWPGLRSEKEGDAFTELLLANRPSLVRAFGPGAVEAEFNKYGIRHASRKGMGVR